MATNNAVNNGLVGANGSGQFVGDNSPSLTTPDIGTPTAGTLTSCTGLPISTGVAGLASGMATFLGTSTSANLAATVTDETGSGSLCFATSPTLVTPNLGAATATSLSVNSNDVITRVSKVKITATGTYTAPAGLLYAFVEVIGGGGGSGGAATTGLSEDSISGGGGGGGYSASFLTAATIGASQAVTIGSGGAAGAIGANPGGAGSLSSFGALVIAQGGSGGAGGAAFGNNNSLGGQPGFGAAAGTGDMAFPGQSGVCGSKAGANPNNFLNSHGGGNKFIPMNTIASVSATTGIAGIANTGQGASGVSLANSATAIAGAAGGSGAIYITEYLPQ